MSGFAAIFRFDGAPADGEALGRMVDAIAYRGPDGIARWSNGGAALAHLMLRTTAESLEETQPLANEDESLVLVMDGWLANPDELRSDLLARGCRLRSRADAELVLRAFETWGEDCPRHIDGEYAFVVWDARRREAFCVKDHAGMRPLHYHWDGKRLLVASDIAGVLAAADFEQRPNPGMIAEHLANLWYSLDETLWTGVMRMLPAHSMRVGVGGPRLRRYWMPPLEVTIRYRCDEDYAAHYREMLADSVRRASRSHAPVACDVSGGLDSSGVFALAHGLQAEGRLLSPDLKAYTFNFGPDAPPDADELEYARAVTNHLGAELREIAPAMPNLDWFWQRGREDRDLAPYPNAAMTTSLGEALVADGCRVDLNGEGGNEFLEGSLYYFGDLVAERDWRGLARAAREDAAVFGWRATARDFYRYGLGPNAPAFLRLIRRHRAQARLQDPYGLGLRWLSADLRDRLRRRERLIGWRQLAAIRSPARRSLLAALTDGYTGYAHDVFGRGAARLGYEPRSPMYSRQYVEFALATPERLRRRAGQRKWVHVAALEGSLPDKVLHRTFKIHFGFAFERLLDLVNPLMVTRVLQCGMGMIDPAGLEELYECYRREPSGANPIYEAWAVAVCCNLFCGPPAHRPGSPGQGVI